MTVPFPQHAGKQDAYEALQSGDADEGQSDLPRVLVAGAAGTGKSHLLHGVLGGHEAPPLTGQPPLWFISTKYYTAQVELAEHTHTQPGAPPAAAAAEASATAAEVLNPQPEALLLVFSLADPTSLAAVQHLSHSLGEELLEAVEVKLLCATHADLLLPSTTTTSGSNLDPECLPTWVQDASMWAVEHGMELVLCCPTQPAVDARLQLDGDRQGVGRVVEALHAHTWPNLVMKPRGGGTVAVGQAGLAAAGVGAGAAAGSRDAGSGDQVEVQGETQQLLQQPVVGDEGGAQAQHHGEAGPDAGSVRERVGAAAGLGGAGYGGVGGAASGQAEANNGMGPGAQGGDSSGKAAGREKKEVEEQGGGDKDGGEEGVDEEDEVQMERLERLMEEMRCGCGAWGVGCCGGNGRRVGLPLGIAQQFASQVTAGTGEWAWSPRTGSGGGARPGYWAEADAGAGNHCGTW